MGKCKIWLVMIIAALVIPTSVYAKSVNEISYEVTDELAADDNEVIFSYKDNIPLIQNDTVIGYAKIQRFEKLGIWDWNNHTAVKKSIKHSYAINIKITRNKEYTDAFSIACIPSLVDKKGKNVGEYCNVGWSGFPESVSFYSADNEKSIELGVQPITNKEAGLRLKLSFFDLEGNELNNVIISNKIYKSVKVGPKLITTDKPIVITSSNGGKYSVRYKNVYRSLNMLNEEETKFIDFEYVVKYLKKPSKKKVIPTFDPNNGNALMTKVVVAAQTDVSPQYLYDSMETAARLDYYGNGHFYVEDGKKFIKVGDKTKYSQNRFLNDEQASAKYVRFILEFPDEVASDTCDELLKFSGRYKVVQFKLKDYVPKAR